MTKTTKGIIFLLLSAFVYSSLPVFIRSLNASQVTPTAQVLLRYVFAFLIASGYVFLSKTKLIFDKKSTLLLAFTAIFGYSLTNLFFTYGMIYTQVSTALFIFYSFAIMTPILAFFILKEKSNIFNLISLGLGFASLLLLFSPNSLATWKIGGLFAFLSALGQSLYLIARKKLMQYSSQQLLMTSAFSGIIIMAALTAVMAPSFYTEKLMTLSL